MRCSVVILNWNGKKWLEQFLPSVVEFTQQKDVEVVVADNGSTDRSVLLLRESFPDVRLISLDQNYGFAEGYNRAIAQVDSEYVLLLNSDVAVTKCWLDPLLEYMDKHRDVAAAQPKILSYATINEQPHKFEHAGAAGGKIDWLGYPYCRGRKLSSVEYDNLQYKTSDDLFWASGACLIVRTDLYKQLGGLDKHFFAHMEEIDLCWRMQLRGYKIACVTESEVYHVGGGSLNYSSPRKTYLNFRNNLLMLYKNLPSDRLWIVLFLRFLLDYLAAFQMLLTGQLDNFNAVLKARVNYHKLHGLYKHIRKENLACVKVKYPTSISRSTLLIDYYLRRKTT